MLSICIMEPVIENHGAKLTKISGDGILLKRFGGTP